MYDIIVVGAGPAGLTAAIYARRANKTVLVLESQSYGGQIINAHKVENYPGIPNISGIDYATALFEQTKDLGAEIKFETVIEVTEEKLVKTEQNTYNAKAVILATGAKNKKLGIPEEADYIGKGVSYCATCDGNFYKGKDVAVVGGGNTALEDALYLSNIVNKVYLVHRRDTFRGEAQYVEDLKKKDNVEFILNSNVIDLKGEILESIDVKDKDENIKNIKVSGLFVAVGQAPTNDIFKNVVDVDESGYIKTIDDVHTKTKGIYVAGDTRTKDLRQLTTAVSDGSIAATVAIKEMK